MERKAHETLQFLHDMRPDKAGQKAMRPAVPESRAQRLLLGEPFFLIRCLFFEAKGWARNRPSQVKERLVKRALLVPSSGGCGDYPVEAY